MAIYKKLSDYTVNTSPSDGDLIPLLIDNGNSFENALMRYDALKGTKGEDGKDGAGIVSGGTTNQVLAKVNNTDYNTKWMSLNKNSVGLSNVDNTKDIDKPVSGAVQTAINEAVATAMAANRPIGSIYINASDPTSPSILLGFGEWELYGSGRVLVGVNPSDIEYNTAEKQGGQRTHRHKGYQDGDGIDTGDLRAAIGASQGNPAAINYKAIGAINPNTGTGIGSGTYAVTGGYQSNLAYAHYTPVVGYTSSQNNMPEYVTVYIWKRTA